MNLSDRVFIASFVAPLIILFFLVLQGFSEKKKLGKLFCELLENEGDGGTLPFLAGKLREKISSQKERMRALQDELAESRMIPEEMREGVLLTDLSGKIRYMNRFLRDLFSVKEDYAERTVLECFRVPELHDSIRKSLAENVTEKTEIRMQSQQKKRIFIVRTSPFVFREKKKGAMTVFHDVTEIHQLEQARREFVANVSHELKTPLTAIRGFAETLSGGALEDPEVARTFVSRIEKNACQLQNLVEDILKLSAIESGRVDLHKKMIFLEPFCESLRSHFAFFLENKEICLVMTGTEGRTLFADEPSLRQVLRNLIENAIKYSPVKTSITLSVFEETGFLVFSVKDEGMGISQAAQARIFERFYRVDEERSRDVGGTGLGLAIVKHLVQGQKGKIWVESQPGQGATFFFSLPKTG